MRTKNAKPLISSTYAEKSEPKNKIIRSPPLSPPRGKRNKSWNERKFLVDIQAKIEYSLIVMVENNNNNTRRDDDINDVRTDGFSGEVATNPSGTIHAEEGAFPEPISDASQMHRRVARLISMGHSNQDIAAATGMGWRYIHRLRQDPRIQHLAGLHKTLRQVRLDENVERMDDILETALRRFEEALADQDIPPSVMEKLIAQALDRHPSGDFVRQRKSEHTEVRRVDNETIESLKKIAMRTNAEAIDVPSTPSGESSSSADLPDPMQPKNRRSTHHTEPGGDLSLPEHDHSLPGSTPEGDAHED